MGSHDTSVPCWRLLDRVEVVEQARIEECCGFGGTFSLLHPEISEAIVTDKVASIKGAGANRCVSADCGCLLNITGRAAKQDELAGRSAVSLPGNIWRVFCGNAPNRKKESHT
jgi:L-lactate dehydrogenase complex protein LldE